MSVADQTAPNSFDSPLAWINFGVLGLLVLGFVTGWIWTKVSVDKILEERDRCLRERDRAYAERDDMAKVMQDRLLPLVGQFVSTTSAFLPVLQQLGQLGAILPGLQTLIDRSRSGPGPG